MSASEVKELLASWQLPEEVIDLIIGEGYDSIDLIRCLTPEEVATNVVHFPKAVFKTLYCKGWRSKFLPEGPPTTSQPTETVLTLIHGESRTITTKDLQCPPTEIDDPSTRSRGDLLKTNRVFRLLKDSHSPALVKKALSGGQLSRAEATRLVHLWTDFCSKSSEAAGEKRWKTSYTQLQLWAEEIVECFPSESVGAWALVPREQKDLVPPTQVGNCSIDITITADNKGQSTSKKDLPVPSLMQVTLLISFLRRATVPDKIKNLVDKNPAVGEIRSADISSLSDNNRLPPSLLSAWSDSTSLRHQWLQGGAPIEEYLDYFPLLRDGKAGPILVESDGIEAYNYQVGKLRKILQDYSTAVTLAARQKAEEVGDSSCVKTKIHILLDLYDKTVGNRRFDYILLLLPYIFKPGQTESGTHRTRVTALDAARYFVHRVADEAELTEFEEGRIEHLKQSIRKQHNNYSEEQIDGEVINVLKPIITAFGPSWDNISHYNVNIPAGKSPRIIYSFSSLVEASAYFVLSVFALHINYPNPCESVWVFIQQKLLEIQPDSLTCRSQSYCESLRFLESFLDNRDLPQYLSEDPQEGSTLSFAPLIISTPSEKSLYCSLTVVEPQQVGSSQNLSASSPLKGVTEGELTSQPKKSDWGLTEGEESVAKKVSPPVLSEASSSEEEGPSTRVPPSKKRRVKRRL
ncbi:hypothetical protein GE061_011713 [Apolygus lucorum]|uniref:Uncharacterized protein n=1 Tax=Apolygus lucorum TaxID=248454 RepID=A0A8S9XZG7_APOLU|nr:hypothetical protein GE061_004477 [Apolygus lucorum]KAF6213984.1 hypothetical protein GE061_011713 [Apolygus lucorum]